MAGGSRRSTVIGAVVSVVVLAAALIWRLVWFLPQLLIGVLALGIYRWDRRGAAG